MSSVDLELPNEIWLGIIGHLETGACIALARVSRRLNALVVSIPPFSDRLKNRKGSIHITVSCLRRHRRSFVSPSLDDLDLFSVMLDVASIEHLTCTLDSPCELKYHFLAPDYRRLTAFILRLPNLRHISLQLEQPPRRTDSHRLLNLSGWIIPLSNLLNACVSRGCTSFEVSRGHYPGDSFVPMIDYSWSPSDIRGAIHLIPAVKRRLIYTDKVTRRGLGWRLSPVHHKGYLNPTPSLQVYDPGDHRHQDKFQPILTTLTLGTGLLLLPPFSNWTYQLASTAPFLTTLVIQNVSMSSPHWRIALCWLCPALQFQNMLKSLTFDNCPGLETEPMLYFVKQFGRSLENLTLLCGLVPRTGSDSLHGKYNSKVDLPKLVSIRGWWPIVLRLALDKEGRAARTLEKERAVVVAMKARYKALKDVKIEMVNHTGLGSRTGKEL